MTYQQALTTLNFSGNYSKEKYAKLAGNMLNSYTRSTPLRFKVAARTLATGKQRSWRNLLKHCDC